MKTTRRDGIGGAFATFLLTRSGNTGAVFSDLRAARAVGAAYLRTHSADGLDPAELRASKSAIADAVRDDFANGRIVSVDGWMLAETEARLCALARLLA